MKKNTNEINQSGRSMVEMLGVLAIIGVLSVGGIAGYTTAMNKHRANEILNAASVRAMAVSTQIQNGSSSPTLAEFTDNKVGSATFGTDVKNTAGTGAWVKGTDNQFSLTLSGVDSNICNQMKNIAGESSIIKAWGDNCSFLTYNNDLGKENPAPSYDDNAGARLATPDDPCDESQQEVNGKCVSFCTTVGTYYGMDPVTYERGCMSIPTTECLCPGTKACVEMHVYSETECPQKGGNWSDGPFGYSCYNDNWEEVGECPLANTSCQTNTDCDTPNEYCSIRAQSATRLTSGTCKPIGTKETVNIPSGDGSAFNGYVYSTSTMSWWSADNWCKAQGMHLVSLGEVYCTTTSCITTGDKNSYVAFTDGQYWVSNSSSLSEPYLFGYGGFPGYGPTRDIDNYSRALCKR